MPYKSEYDTHKVGSMADTDYQFVVDLFKDYSNVEIYKGTIPETFIGLENTIISLAHIDVDNYESVKHCIKFIYPRIISGGYIIFDDYGCGSCPGAKKAVDEYLSDKVEKIYRSGENDNPQAFIKKC
jgi:O-methyltransferase